MYIFDGLIFKPKWFSLRHFDSLITLRICLSGFLLLLLGCGPDGLTDQERLCKRLQKMGCFISANYTPDGGPDELGFGYGVPGDISPNPMKLTDEIIDKLKVLHRLRIINFFDNDFSNSQIDKILNIVQPDTVRISKIKIDDNLLKLLLNKPSIQDLVLSGTGLGFNDLCRFAEMPNLKSIYIVEENLDNEKIEALNKVYSKIDSKKFFKGKPGWL